jgi:hypothetical protein
MLIFSLYCELVTDWKAEELWFDYWKGQKFSLLHRVQTITDSHSHRYEQNTVDAPLKSKVAGA